MKLSRKAFGLAVGYSWGLAIFLLTNIMILRGGAGQHLRVLGYLYAGYSFSFFGSIIGLIWGIVTGFLMGWLFAFFYNLFVKT